MSYYYDPILERLPSMMALLRDSLGVRDVQDKLESGETKLKIIKSLMSLVRRDSFISFGGALDVLQQLKIVSNPQLEGMINLSKSVMPTEIPLTGQGLFNLLSQFALANPRISEDQKSQIMQAQSKVAGLTNRPINAYEFLTAIAILIERGQIRGDKVQSEKGTGEKTGAERGQAGRK